MNRYIQFLSLLFGFGSWITMTGFWAELPLLIQVLPEGWSLASYLNIMIQIANIGPLLYWIAKRKQWCNEVSATHAQMMIGACACLLLILFWDKTFYIFGKPRSLILFICAFGLSIVDCTSSVTFLPFMGRFNSVYLTPYLIGEGLSGFIPTIVALIQGVGDPTDQCIVNGTDNVTDNRINNGTEIEISEPRFSIEIFFTSLLFTLLLSWTAFSSLQMLPMARREQLKHLKSLKIVKTIEIENTEDTNDVLLTEKHEPNEQIVQINNKISDYSYNYLLILIGWCCISTFGIFPSLQPYSCLPYGHDILHYAVIVSGLSYPLGCFLAMFIEMRSQFTINCLTLIGTLMSVYIGICALQSPSPPLHHTPIGSVIIVIVWFLFIFILSYVKTIITLIVGDMKGDDGLFWIGMYTQFGSAIGAAFIFIIINFTNIFQESC